MKRFADMQYRVNIICGVRCDQNTHYCCCHQQDNDHGTDLSRGHHAQLSPYIPIRKVYSLF